MRSGTIRTLSVHTRLLIAASVVLVAFLGLTGLALDQAFRDSARLAVQERLQAQVYMLLGAAEFNDADGLVLPPVLPEVRFSTAGSGLYARVEDEDGGIVWRSLSLVDLGLPAFPGSEPGEFRFEEVAASDGTPLFALSFAVSWEVAPDTYRRYVFRVAESKQGFYAQVRRFRQSLGGWLLAASLMLLAVQGIILRWSLKPLRQVAGEVREIESGRQVELAGSYPRELQPLTGSLNAFIRHSRSHLERYRNALGDLAHSLKTPLAVLHGAVEEGGSAERLRETVQEQVARMNRTVEYQLQRAAASGRIALAAPVPVAPVARKMVDTLAKVYAGKRLQFDLHIEEGAAFHGDEGDLMETLGNLIDNACKWSRSRVAIRAATPGAGDFVLEVEDDGPGIPAEIRRAILDRGRRADPGMPGHGIGLAVVRNIVEEVYRGSLEIGDGALGGARVRMRLRF